MIRLLQKLKRFETVRIFNGQRHKQRMHEFYAQFINEGDLCFDVGANVGNRTEIFLELGATVVAVEPQAACARRLHKKYGRNKKVITVQQALGEAKGEARLMVSNAHTISSLSNEWINAVKTSARFAAYKWDRSVTVPVTTLDELIADYGQPAFCKIDVEGYEFQVLRGLSRPIRTISFEFTPEFIHATIDSVQYLSSLGSLGFNYSIGESMQLALPEWVDSEHMRQLLTSLPDPDRTLFGDVYAKELSQKKETL